MSRLFICLALIATLIAGVLAQPDPNGPAQPTLPNKANPGLEWVQKFIADQAIKLGAQPALVTPTAQGVFVLRAGVLAKYDPTTMEMVKMVELFGPLPAGDAAADKQKMLMEYMKRLLPAAMLAPKNGDLIISIGDAFFCVDPATMEKTVAVNVAGELQPQQQLARLPALVQTPTLQLIEQSVILARGNKLMTIARANGKVLFNIDLPEQMNLNPFQPGGNKLAAGGAAGGPVAAGEVTVVGTITFHPEMKNFAFAVKDAQNQEYLLYGPQANAFTATPNIQGRKARVAGTLYKKDGLPDGVVGIIMVNTTQLLDQ